MLPCFMVSCSQGVSAIYLYSINRQALGFGFCRIRRRCHRSPAEFDRKPIFGGTGAADIQLSITNQGSGLKIWASWQVYNHVVEKPLFAGKATIAMAHEICGITNPEDGQLRLF